MSTANGERWLLDSERTLMAVAGIALLALSWIVWFCPGERVQVAPEATTSPFTTVVSADPTFLVVFFAAAGCVFILFALNGLRVVHLKAGNVEARTMEVPKAAFVRVATRIGGFSKQVDEVQKRFAVPAEKNAPGGEKARADEEEPAGSQSDPPATVWIEGEEYGVYRVEDVPSEVVSALLDSPEWKDRGYGSLEAEFIARRSGRGNHAWLFKFKNRDTLWWVSRGGQGKREVTITAVPAPGMGSPG